MDSSKYLTVEAQEVLQPVIMRAALFQRNIDAATANTIVADGVQDLQGLLNQHNLIIVHVNILIRNESYIRSLF